MVQAAEIKTLIAVLDSIQKHAHSISLHSVNGETIRCEIPELEINEVVRINPKYTIEGNLTLNGVSLKGLPLIPQPMEVLDHYYSGLKGDKYRHSVGDLKFQMIQKFFSGENHV